MRVTILGSGSEGNALLLETGDTAVLVDAGLSHRKLLGRFEQIGRQVPERVDAVLVTHSHGDHAAHASTYALRFGCPVFASEETLRSIRLRPEAARRPFVAGKTFRVGDLGVGTHRLPHDAPQVAMRFEADNTRVGLVTDLGHAPKDLPRFLSGCETLLLESNHDEMMLAEGPYPTRLKQRVGGALGHLSNAQASDLLAELDYTPTEVVLMHLSKANNSPQLARASAEAALGHCGTRLRLASQNRPLELGLSGARQYRLSL